jgi:hypothetical protein
MGRSPARWLSALDMLACALSPRAVRAASMVGKCGVHPLARSEEDTTRWFPLRAPPSRATRRGAMAPGPCAALACRGSDQGYRYVLRDAQAGQRRRIRTKRVACSLTRMSKITAWTLTACSKTASLRHPRESGGPERCQRTGFPRSRLWIFCSRRLQPALCHARFVRPCRRKAHPEGCGYNRCAENRHSRKRE